MQHSVFLAGGVVFLTAAVIQAGSPFPERAHWLTADRLEHPLRAGELGKAECAQIRSAFFGSGDPRETIEALRTKPDATRKELRGLAAGISLEAREDEKGVQPDGRIALLWWDTKQNQARRSTAAKDNVFNPDTDRLLAALAVLDNKAIRHGKWVPWEERPVLPIPDGWPKDDEVEGRWPALGLALGAARPVSAGDFTAERTYFYVARAFLGDFTARWMMKKEKDAKEEYANAGDRVTVLIVYEYEKLGDHSPIGYRFYAVSASGKLEAQCRAWLHDLKRKLPSTQIEREQFDDN
jgi:hypothetical protein